MGVVFGLSQWMSFAVLMFVHQPVLDIKTDLHALIWFCQANNLYLSIEDITWIHSDNLLSVWSQE